LLLRENKTNTYSLFKKIAYQAALGFAERRALLGDRRKKSEATGFIVFGDSP
jgi:hypothetical protein